MNSEMQKLELEEEEDFATLLEESFKKAPEELKEGVIVAIGDDFVTIDVGGKMEGRLNLSEIKNEDGSLKYKVGDKIAVTSSGTKNERPILSHLNALKQLKVKEFIQNNSNYAEQDVNIEGTITRQNKGGFIIEADGVEFFLPKSLSMFKMDEKPVGRSVSAKVVKIDNENNSIVVSRKKSGGGGEKKKFKQEVIDKLINDGEIVEGVVKKITSYGMFVEAEGVDGLVHYNEISHKGPVNPAKYYNVGDTVKIKAISFDKDKKHLSFSIKATSSDPWNEIKDELEVGDTVKAMVSNIENYGAFVDIGNDIEGFLHISEISWQKNISHPKEVLTVGEELTVEIIELNYNEKRLRVSLKKLLPRPFEDFARKHKVGDAVKGVVTSVTDFGAFIKIGQVEGLLHNENFSWNRSERCKDFLKSGDEVEARIIKIETEKEKISLSKKELDESPIHLFAKKYKTGDLINGTVREIKDFGVFVTIEEGVDALIRTEDLYPKRADEIVIGDPIEGTITMLDPDTNKLRLSIKRVQRDKDKEALKKFNQSGSKAGFNDTLKDKLNAG